MSDLKGEARDAHDSRDLLPKLHDWLEQSGRALELRTTRRFREARARVRPSFAYQDVRTRDWREIDVIADYSWRGHLDEMTELECSLTAVVECKSTVKHPWVAFQEKSALARTSQTADWLADYLAPDTRVIEQVPRLWISHDPFTDPSPASHVVAAHLGDRRNNEANPANDALRQVLSAVDALRADYIDRQGRDSRGMFVIPVIVTAAPLFTCRLTDSNTLDLQATSLVNVWGYRPVDGRRTRIFVMNETELPWFTKALLDRARDAAQI